MTSFKILVNSTLSTPGARWLGLDIKNYYLGTPMEDYEYMFIPITSIPHEIIAHYKLQEIVHNGKVYMEIRRRMYGLPQAGILANNNLSVSSIATATHLYATPQAFGVTHSAP